MPPQHASLPSDMSYKMFERWFCCCEGYAYPESAVTFFLQQAEQNGASILYEHPVQSLETGKSSPHITGISFTAGMKVTFGHHRAALVVIMTNCNTPQHCSV